MGVSTRGGSPKPSILVGFSLINHLFWGTPMAMETHMAMPPDSVSRYHPRWQVTLDLESWSRCNMGYRWRWICRDFVFRYPYSLYSKMTMYVWQMYSYNFIYIYIFIDIHIYLNEFVCVCDFDTQKH